MTWKFHVYDSANGRYDMILGGYILTSLGSNLKIYDQVIEEYYGPFEGSMAPVFYLGMYEFKYLNTGNIEPEK